MEIGDTALRVLGCLLEKERTTPDAYPLTVHALVAACNQSTNREPVVSYDERTVEAALTELRERGLARRGVYPGSRVPKHRHVVGEALGLGPAEQAVLCVLLLRGPQTPGELKGRTERLHAFGDLDDVVRTLEGLMAGDQPLVRRLPRQPGQKEARYAHLLGTGPAVASAPRVEPEPAPRESRLGVLEQQVRELQDEVAALRDELAGLRRGPGE